MFHSNVGCLKSQGLKSARTQVRVRINATYWINGTKYCSLDLQYYPGIQQQDEVEVKNKVYLDTVDKSTLLAWAGLSHDDGHWS